MVLSAKDDQTTPSEVERSETSSPRARSSAARRAHLGQRTRTRTRSRSRTRTRPRTRSRPPPRAGPKRIIRDAHESIRGPHPRGRARKAQGRQTPTVGWPTSRQSPTMPQVGEPRSHCCDATVLKTREEDVALVGRAAERVKVSARAARLAAPSRGGGEAADGDTRAVPPRRVARGRRRVGELEVRVQRPAPRIGGARIGGARIGGACIGGACIGGAGVRHAAISGIAAVRDARIHRRAVPDRAIGG